MRLSPSTSVADTSNTKDVSSSIAWSDIEAITGASLTDVTVNVNVPIPVNEPSLADTVTAISPL